VGINKYAEITTKFERIYFKMCTACKKEKLTRNIKITSRIERNNIFFIGKTQEHKNAITKGIYMSNEMPIRFLLSYF